ncbi:MprA protease, GlyGly-CTERM protein-sorting domain-containing form [Sporosarcina sp. SAFN-010]
MSLVLALILLIIGLLGFQQNRKTNGSTA